MLRIAITFGLVVLAAVLIGGSFLILQNSCSWHESANANAPDNGTTDAEPRNEESARKNGQPHPSATFDLRVTAPNKIEGGYYPDDKSKKERDWGKTFLCETKIGEFAIACLTLFLVVFTALLWHSTDKLWAVTRDSAEAALRQSNIMAAVEGPVPLVAGIKLVQYQQIPGEVTLIDPVLSGPIPANCRIMIAVENKGRTPLRMIELCVEKFIGLSLPPEPDYAHRDQWGLILEKGPLWIRASENLAVVTAAEVGAATAAYPEGAFWVFGYFAYWSLLNEKRIHKFAARWDLAQGFVPENRSSYT